MFLWKFLKWKTHLTEWQWVILSACLSWKLQHAALFAEWEAGYCDCQSMHTDLLYASVNFVCGSLCIYACNSYVSVPEGDGSLCVDCALRWVNGRKTGATRTLTCTSRRSVGKKQWCIPAHISPAGDNCAISQRVLETLFTACCGGMGGGYELMSLERKTTSSYIQTLMQIPQEYACTLTLHTNMHIRRKHSPISKLFSFSR